MTNIPVTDGQNQREKLLVEFLDVTRKQIADFGLTPFPYFFHPDQVRKTGISYIYCAWR